MVVVLLSPCPGGGGRGPGPHTALDEAAKGGGRKSSARGGIFLKDPAVFCVFVCCN